jgi:large repetitive protein
VAVYGGDSNLIGSTSNVVRQFVNKGTTTTTLVSSQNPSSVGQSVTFTANVKPPYGGTVKGTVTFYADTTKLAIQSLSGGPVTITTSKLAAGSHTISATYGGNANFTGSSASLTQSVD